MAEIQSFSLFDYSCFLGSVMKNSVFIFKKDIWFIRKQVFYLKKTTVSVSSNSVEYCFSLNFALREKCPCSELFWSVFSHIRTKYGEILWISPYLVRMRDTDQNNSEHGHFYAMLRVCSSQPCQQKSVKKLVSFLNR